MNKKLVAAIAAAASAVAMLPGIPVIASTAHYENVGEALPKADWDAYVAEWNEEAADFTKVSMAPGRNETELNFAWMTPKAENNGAIVYFGTSVKNLQKFTGTVSATDSKLTGGKAYVSNKVTVTGLKPETRYYYQVVKNGVKGKIGVYETQSFSDVKILFVGDPQIGASKGQTQNGDKLVAADGAANTAARNDAYAWNRTLTAAAVQNPDVSFIISAGDQVNKTGKPKEEEYAGYLGADLLERVPVATTIGNHDSLNSDYSAHFNTPNATDLGTTKAGGDYYYSYGDALFIVLNTNNYNVAQHEEAIKKAVASDPKAPWRIVCYHQDIYGSGLDHSETDGMILRTQLTPIFDKYDIDVALQGHDHTYSRSKLLYGDGQTHGTYEFRLNESGSDYDWDNAYNTQTNEKVGLYPEDGDAAGIATLDAFRNDNHCYTIEDVEGNTVVNPQGTLYMTSNSASGSKYYELNPVQQDYIAERSQNWLPSYSVIEISANKFTIDTYQLTEEGKTEKIDDTFTIVKN